MKVRVSQASPTRRGRFSEEGARVRVHEFCPGGAGRFLRPGVVLLITLWLAGCTPLTGYLPPPVEHAGSGRLLAGAARLDITPLPGFPMGGHSFAGKVARGFWTRLFARAVYLEAPGGAALVLVSCDLWSVPGGLGDRVAELLAKQPALAHLGRERIVLAATHTHHSPGNFSTSKLYNSFASPQEGFDRDLFEYLAVRIADAIARAAADARPARVYGNHGSIESRLVRNRSMEAFRLNPEANDVLEANRDLPLCKPSPEYPDEEACRAVYPIIQTLRFEEAGGGNRLIAGAAFLAVHPTVLTAAQTEVYSADLFGVAALTAERHLRDTGDSDPVIALFNGAEGDVSATWERRDRGELLTLGEALASRVVAVIRGGELIGTDLASQYEVARVAGRCFRDPVERGSERRCTSPRAVSGLSQIGGAEDGRTQFHDLGFTEGLRGSPGPEGSKRSTLGSILETLRVPLDLTPMLVAMYPVPQEVPIGVYRIGDRILATLPGEFTTTIGMRIRNGIARQLAVDPYHVLLVGLANEYLSYFTTPEEYDAQHYEGASTLYGQASGPLIRSDLERLAAALSEESTKRLGRSYRYSPGGHRSFGLHNIGSPTYFTDDGLAPIVQDPEGHTPRRNVPSVCWNDAAPTMEHGVEASASLLPRVAILDDSRRPLVIDGAIQDNFGLDMVTLAAGQDDRGSQWCAIWLRPEVSDLPERVSFRIDRIDGTTCRSAEFQPSDGWRGHCTGSAP